MLFTLSGPDAFLLIIIIIIVIGISLLFEFSDSGGGYTLVASLWMAFRTLIISAAIVWAAKALFSRPYPESPMFYAILVFLSLVMPFFLDRFIHT